MSLDSREEKFYVEVKSSNADVRVLALYGPLDHQSLERFKTILDEADREGVKFLILDCSSLSFINSRSLGALVHLQKKLRKVSGGLYLCQLSSSMVGLLQQVRFDKVVPLCKTVEEAEEKIRELSL